MTPSEALLAIEEQAQRILKETVFKLHTDLIKVAPVGTPESTGIKGYVGGDFKAAWRVREYDEWNYMIYNNMNYASILWRGRNFYTDAGHVTGSKQRPFGGNPMLEKANIEMQRRFDAIKE